MFEQAARLKLRFKTNKGSTNAEGLWDLPLTSKVNPNLDDIAKGISRELSNSKEESFVTVRSSGNSVLELQLNIVKRVIAVKLQERNDRRNAEARATENAKLLEIKAKRNDAALDKLTDAEIDARLAANK